MNNQPHPLNKINAEFLGVPEQLMDIVEFAHRDQVDKSGQLYLYAHLIPTAHSVPQRLRRVALCHDIFEDTDTPVEAVSEFVGDTGMQTLIRLTKARGEPLRAYYERVREDEDAVIVKVADIVNNLSRLGALSAMEQARLMRKYQFGLTYLALSGR